MFFECIFGIWTLICCIALARLRLSYGVRLLCAACMSFAILTPALARMGGQASPMAPPAAQAKKRVSRPTAYPGLRIERIVPSRSAPGEMVTIHYAFDQPQQISRFKQALPNELTFDGVSAKFKTQAYGVVNASVPFRTRINEPIPVVIGIGSLKSQPYSDFIVTPQAPLPNSEPIRRVFYRVLAVNPNRARPGDPVRIITEPPVDFAKRIEITFNGRPAEVSFDGGALLSRVPMDLLTDSGASLILTVGGQQSVPFDKFYVLPLPLRVRSITPNPARPGDTVSINIQPPFQFKPGAEWMVQFDSIPVRPSFVHPERFGIVAQIPEALKNRTPAVILISSGQRSDPFTGLIVEQPASTLYITGSIALGILACLVVFWRMRKWLARFLFPEPSSPEGSLRPTEDKSPISYTLQEIPEELVTACRNNECVLYVGAGLSAAAGFPTYEPFVRNLLDWAAGKQLLDASLADSLRKALEQGQSGTVAENVVSALRGRESLLNDYLRSVFVDPVPELPKAHTIIREIAFSGVLTTNFDTLIERTFAGRNTKILTPSDPEPLMEALLKRDFFILKLYGTPERPETVLVAPDQYLDAIARNASFTQYMETLFLSRSILFLGASLEGIENYLRGITFRESRGKPHFALVNTIGTGWFPKASSLTRRYGIQVLPYTASAGFPEIETFLTRLQRKIGTLSAEAKQFKRVSLKRVRLENIGPFDELEIELDAHMNVLLGDNGVGKSTVLKAIAVGTLGKNSEDDKGILAARLIKAKQPEARITLETERGRYFAQLRRTGEGAEIITRGGRPLDEESWLALGFPPLRFVRWGPAVEKEDTEENRPSRSMPSDLLPLLRGEPDPRMEDLKSWLLHLDHLMKYEKDQGDTVGKYGRLLDEFFRMVGLVTEGITVNKGKIDPTTGRIFVQTDDGELPLEALSQGTQSLIGWIGIILQRLFEWYGDSQDPTSQFALLLIDEIDAHMHPYWQQTIVPHLRELFPNVQFIATTHSPLIVTEVRREQVQVLARNPDTKGIAVRYPNVDSEFLRADQILTSPLFGLGRSRGRKAAGDIATYADLLGKTKRTSEEDTRLQELRAKLMAGFMSTDTPARRQVEEAVRTTLRQMKLAEVGAPAGTKQELSEDMKLEIRRQLAELFGKGEQES